MDLIKQIINLDEDKLLVTGRLEETNRDKIKREVEKAKAKKTSQKDDESQVELGTDDGIQVDSASRGTARIKSNVWMDLEKIMDEIPEPDANFFITNQEAVLGLFERAFELEKEANANTSYDIKKKSEGDKE